jgi:glycine/D-amino acid oxidase-like deaminating enzyme
MPHRFSRREMLVSLLGLPLVAGCERASVNALESTVDRIEGEIVGPSVGIGHRLRDGFQPRESDAWESHDVVIIGGGIAGLSAAWQLHRSGYRDFVLLELEEVAGGTSRSGTSQLVGYPWGAHYLPAPLPENRRLQELLRAVGVYDGEDEQGNPRVAEQFLCRDPEERVFYKGRWYEGLYLHAGESAEDVAQLARFEAEMGRWVEWRDGHGRRAFASPLGGSSDDAEVAPLDRISMAEWMDKAGFTSARLRWLVDYSCRDDYGLRMEQGSAWAGVFYFASRLASAGAAPQPLITWPQGNGRLVDHLHGVAKEQVRLGWMVTNVKPVDGKDEVEVTAYSPRTEKVAGIRAKRVIFAAPQFLVRYLIAPYRQEPPAHLNEFQYGSWLVANVHLRGRPAERGFPLAWDNVLYESPSLGYVVATHQRGIDHGPTILTYYYPFCDDEPRGARERLLAMDWRDCASLVMADLSRAHRDIGALVERIDVMRWGHAMIRPTPGFIWGQSRRSAAAPVGGIHFANTDLSGVALFEEAFDHGVRAADEVMTAMKLSKS